MARLPLLAPLLLALAAADARDVHAQWVFSLGARLETSGYASYPGLDVDAEGDAFVAGWFANTVAFDLQYQPDTLRSQGDVNTIVARYRPDGRRAWTMTFQSTRPGRRNSAVDLQLDGDGAFHLLGHFIGDVIFDGSETDGRLSSLTDGSLYVARFDTNRAFRWARKIEFTGGSFDPEPRMAVDAAGNTYVAGTFLDRAIFETDAGPVTLDIDAECFGLFVARYDPEGALQWAFPLKSGYCDDVGGLAVDDAGNLYVTGGFGGSADFDPGPGEFVLTASGLLNDVFVARYDADGRFLQAFAFGGNEGGNASAFGQALALGDDGDIYVGGRFSKVADFDPGEGTARLEAHSTDLFPEQYDAFVARYDAGGGLRWVRRLGNELPFDRVSALAVGQDGRVLVGGSIDGPAVFGAGADTLRLDGTGFIAVYEPDGALAQAFRIGGNVYDAAFPNAADVYLAGRFIGSADFHPHPETVARLHSTQLSAFVARYRLDRLAEPIVVHAERGPALPETSSAGAAALYPNPTNGPLTLTLALSRPEALRVEVFDVLGRRVALLHDGTLAPHSTSLRLDVAGLANGLYVLRVRGARTTASAPFVVAK